MGIGIVVAVLALLGLALTVIAPGLLQDRLRDEATRALAPYRIVPDVGGVEFTLRGEVALRDVCLHPVTLERAPLACIERIEVELDGLPRRREDIVVRKVILTGGWIHAQRADGTAEAWSELAARARPDRDRPPAGPATPGTVDDRADRPLPEVRVERITVRTDLLDGASRAFGLLGWRLQAEAEGEPRWTAQGTVEPPAETLALDAAPVQVTLPARILVQAEGGSRAVSMIRIAAEQEQLVRVRLETPLGPVDLRWGAFQFSGAADFAIEDLELDVAGPDGAIELLRTSRVEVDLRELPRTAADVYLSRVSLAAPHVVVDTALPVIAGLLPPLAPEDLGEDAPAVPDDEAPGQSPPVGSAEDDPDASAASGDGWREAIAARPWFEVWPQFVEFENARFTLVDRRDAAGPRTLVLEDLALRYALRVFRMQIDVALRGALLSGDGHALGTFDVEAAWGYANRKLTLEAALERLDLPRLLEWAPPVRGLEVASGRATARLRYRDADRGQPMSAGIELEVEGFEVSLPYVRQPVRVDRLTYVAQAEEIEDERESADSPPRRHLDVTRGEGSLNGARFHFRPRVRDWSMVRSPHASALDIAFEIPDQPAQDLLTAVPQALRPDLDGVRLGGRFGQTLIFRIDLLESESDRSRPRIRIHAPTTHDFRDRSLVLEAIPQQLDPRRLVHGFDFVFRGPEDRIQRRMSVPPFHSVLEPPDRDRVVDAWDSPERSRRMSRTEAEGWAPLDEISYWLIAMQLHREDGRFFENTGVNWYQVRRVVEEAWNRETGFRRGASTITMQLVKNLLLSHDRTAERKVQELFLTYWVTRTVPKERILELYLNLIEWGPGVNGIVEAADHYFGKTPDDLTLAEATWLSAITPAPMRRGAQRDRGQVPDWFWRQCQQLMRSLERRRMITERELQHGLAQRPRFVTADPEPPGPDAGVAPPDDEETGDDGGVAEIAAVEAPAQRVGPQDRFLRLPPEARTLELIGRSRGLTGFPASNR